MHGVLVREAATDSSESSTDRYLADAAVTFSIAIPTDSGGCARGYGCTGADRACGYRHLEVAEVFPFVNRQSVLAQ
jgi:hypothetical protein